MVTTSDFIGLEYTADLTRAGIAYARKLLVDPHAPFGRSVHNQFRRIVAGVAVELAFRRYLNNSKIPHSNLEATPFTVSGRFDILIGGRRCNIQLSTITQKRHIRKVHKDPGVILGTQALVPKEQITSDHLHDEDLYVFAFLNALVTPNLRTLHQAILANQPVTLIHALPSKWCSPDHWGSLGKLALKSDFDETLSLALDGQDTDRKYQTEQITLYPRVRTTAKGDFYTLSYLHTSTLPEGAIGVHSPLTKDTHLIQPIEWGNIWVYGMQITLAGYMTRGEFRNRAGKLHFGSDVIQYNRTRTEDLSLPVSDLYPLQDLFGRAKSWGKNKHAK